MMMVIWCRDLFLLHLFEKKVQPNEFVFEDFRSYFFLFQKNAFHPVSPAGALSDSESHLKLTLLQFCWASKVTLVANK